MKMNQLMTVIIEGKEELRKIDRYEIPLSDGSCHAPDIPRTIPKLKYGEEILHTFDGKTIIIKK